MTDFEPTDDDQLPAITPPDRSSTADILSLKATTPFLIPALIADLGEHATLRFIDFFTAIRNPNTRAAYAVAVRRFFSWLETHGPGDLGAIRTHHVSA